MNARLEFISHIQNKEVLCLEITYVYDGESDEESKVKRFHLTKGYTIEEYNDLLKSLDFEYDSGYGSQELFGNIWYKDGTWSDRYEYDGSECWDYQSSPDIPDYLNRVDKIRDEKLNTIL